MVLFKTVNSENKVLLKKVFDDEGVAQLGVEVFFCGRGGDGLTKDDFHGGSHSYLVRAFVNV